jgi:AcrR family transcriptional regulator
LRAAESLLELGGPDAVTTRAVCDAANVEAPTLYHRYGDKNGLFDALVAKGVKTFLKRKQAGPDTADALADLIPGWESFVGSPWSARDCFDSWCSESAITRKSWMRPWREPTPA